jgi:hypothetical protein
MENWDTFSISVSFHNKTSLSCIYLGDLGTFLWDRKCLDVQLFNYSTDLLFRQIGL